MPADTLLGDFAGSARKGYDPNQPRDWHGRWTDSGHGTPDAAIEPIKDPGKPPNHNPTPRPSREECNREWERAAATCKSLLERGQIRPGSPWGATPSDCECGLVSEACGGNKNLWTPIERFKGKPGGKRRR